MSKKSFLFAVSAGVLLICILKILIVVIAKKRIKEEQVPRSTENASKI